MNSPSAMLAEIFACSMAQLAPFESRPQLGVAVSGGADSLALALLARDWTNTLNGSLLALVVDHGLRQSSADEAREAVAQLTAQTIATRLLTLSNIESGGALAARARGARYLALKAACAEANILHLLLGHHAADQAETVLIRNLAGSGLQGLAGMPALFDQPRVRVLRPLLDVPSGCLKELLKVAGVDWVEDPSNADLTVRRPRMRHLRCDAVGSGSATQALAGAAAALAAARAAKDREIGMILAQRIRLYPEGFAVLSPGELPPQALAALIRTISGAAFPPATAAVAHLAAAMRPATLGGVRFLKAGRFGPGWLVAREAAALPPPIPARSGAIWDRRFCLTSWAEVEPGITLGALGHDAVTMRICSRLPSTVLAALPALRRGGRLVAVPHIGYNCGVACNPLSLVFAPACAMVPAPFKGLSRTQRLEPV